MDAGSIFADPNEQLSEPKPEKRPLKSKWTAFLLCLFPVTFGAHKFYEGKTGLGGLYIFTFGLWFIGVIVDFVKILGRPDPYDPMT